MKFILTDGKKCYSTNMSIVPEERENLKVPIQRVLELLVLWVRQNLSSFTFIHDFCRHYPLLNYCKDYSQ